MPHEPTLSSPRISWYLHNICPSLRRSICIPKLTKLALLGGAAKRNAKLPSNSYSCGSIFQRVMSMDSPMAVARFVPGTHAASVLVPLEFPIVLTSAWTSKLAPERRPAPSIGSDLIIYLFALSYSELLWNDNLLRTDVFLPPCQHSVESLPLTPEPHLRLAAFPHTLLSLWSLLRFLLGVFCLCILCSHKHVFLFLHRIFHFIQLFTGSELFRCSVMVSEGGRLTHPPPS